MHFLGLLVLSLARIFRLLINLYTFVIAFAVIISWVNPDPANPLVRLSYQLTQPVFRRVRRFMPASLLRTHLDWTPLLVFILLILIDTVLIGTLFDMGGKLLSK